MVICLVLLVLLSIAEGTKEKFLLVKTISFSRLLQREFFSSSSPWGIILFDSVFKNSEKKACEEVGITSFGVNLPEDSSEDEVLWHVRAFNEDPLVHGILVQLPLPKVWKLSLVYQYE